MENRDDKGVFLYTKKIDSELMVRCLFTILNNLPDIKFTAIIADEAFLGYRVHFSNAKEQAVLALVGLKVFGQNIQICPLKTYLKVDVMSSRKDYLTAENIIEEIESKFGKLEQSINNSVSISRLNENNQFFRVVTNMPEIKAKELIQQEGSNRLLLHAPNKYFKLKVTLCCRLCKKDGHAAQDCKENAPTGMEWSNDENGSTSDSAVNVESKIDRLYENLGREEIMKKGYYSPGNNQTGEKKIQPDLKKIKKEPENESKAGTKSYENLPGVSYLDEAISVEPNDDDDFDDDDDDDDDNDDKDDKDFRITHRTNPTKRNFNFRRKSGSDQADDDSNAAHFSPENTASSNAGPLASPGSSNAGPPTSPGSSNPARRRTMQQPVIAVEDMSVLSEPLQECIDEAISKFNILSKKDLQSFFHHCKKKSNVVEVARKYIDDETELKEMLKYVSKLYWSTSQPTKEDKRFIKWLEERIERFGKKVPQKRKRTN